MGSKPPRQYSEAAQELRFRLIPPIRLWSLMREYAEHRGKWFHQPITHPDIARLAVVRAKEFAGARPHPAHSPEAAPIYPPGRPGRTAYPPTPPAPRRRSAVEWDILLDQLVSHAEQQPHSRDEGVDPALQLAEEALDDVKEFLEQHARLIIVLSDPETRRKLLWLRVRKMMVGSVRGRSGAFRWRSRYVMRPCTHAEPRVGTAGPLREGSGVDSSARSADRRERRQRGGAAHSGRRRHIDAVGTWVSTV